ncbi:cysteine-rich protein 1-like [Mixophyes fleayi]|uniref:cysteine-rich protein 1-like n=1 Tax=Mixophyes fleayi TaxID=3061075 RepID=UPI003F4DAD1D
MILYCPICGKPVYFAERKHSLGKDYHPLCLKCFQCKRQLTAGQHAEYDDKPFCNRCYLLHFGPRVTRGPAFRGSLGQGASSSSSTLAKGNQS